MNSVESVQPMALNIDKNNKVNYITDTYFQFKQSSLQIAQLSTLKFLHIQMHTSCFFKIQIPLLGCPNCRHNRPYVARSLAHQLTWHNLSLNITKTSQKLNTRAVYHRSTTVPLQKCWRTEDVLPWIFRLWNRGEPRKLFLMAWRRDLQWLVGRGESSPSAKTDNSPETDEQLLCLAIGRGLVDGEVPGVVQLCMLFFLLHFDQ